MLKSIANPLLFRCLISLNNYSMERVFQSIAEIDFMKKFNGGINPDESKFVSLIQSQHSAVIYERRKQYGYFYLPRDYVYLRHVYELNGSYYIVDKSIEHDECPPYLRVIRGEINY